MQWSVLKSTKLNGTYYAKVTRHHLARCTVCQGAIFPHYDKIQEIFTDSDKEKFFYLYNTQVRYKVEMEEGGYCCRVVCASAG